MKAQKFRNRILKSVPVKYLLHVSLQTFSQLPTVNQLSGVR